MTVLHRVTDKALYTMILLHNKKNGILRAFFCLFVTETVCLSQSHRPEDHSDRSRCDRLEKLISPFPLSKCVERPHYAKHLVRLI